MTGREWEFAFGGELDSKIVFVDDWESKDELYLNAFYGDERKVERYIKDNVLCCL